MDTQQNFSNLPDTAQIIEQFNNWYKEESELTKVSIPAACCLSTIGTDGFPNARFVAFKDIVENKFIVTGPLTSRKGVEIEAINKVALTFWWTETGRQVRVQGIAEKIPDALADHYFRERNRDSQLVSIISEQGRQTDDIGMLTEKYENLEKEFSGKSLERPVNWGGYSINPIRIEFLEFKLNRFHLRHLYEQVNGKWTVKQLQP